jgi:hypothetical protein
MAIGDITSVTIPFTTDNSGGGGVGVGSEITFAPYPQANVRPYESDPSANLLRMIGMRLRLHEGPVAMFPFNHIDAYRISEERVVVFVVHKETPVLIEDDGALFPSDALITQLRLLSK